MAYQISSNISLLTIIFWQWTAIAHNATSLTQAFNDRLSNVQIEERGTVIRIQKDDTQGSQHQKFIVRVSALHTILIAHNIDLTSRINTIAKGNKVHYFGEYE